MISITDANSTAARIITTHTTASIASKYTMYDIGDKIRLGSHVFDTAQLGDLLAMLLDKHPELKL